jgi:two-component system KDP operon response regulator KdpE
MPSEILARSIIARLRPAGHQANLVVGHKYEVIEARNGEALTRISAEMPDLVLLDMDMPGMGRLETCQNLRLGSDVPVIILSVRNSEKDKVAALDAGPDDYITKPFGMEELLARIRATLRRGTLPEGNAAVVVGSVAVSGM